ncbi:MAG: hypothetical protein K6G22_07275, partial [Lachnospiraceae bacterium]|nr:hypothetical protein [Lachnospiraceae bacterium]
LFLLPQGDFIFFAFHLKNSFFSPRWILFSSYSTCQALSAPSGGFYFLCFPPSGLFLLPQGDFIFFAFHPAGFFYSLRGILFSLLST